MATATGSTALGGGGGGPGLGERLGGRIVSSRGGWLASFGLGAIFAVGWSPCVGMILGAILRMAATSQTVAQGGLLLVAYTIGLGLPFIAIALSTTEHRGSWRRSSAMGRRSRSSAGCSSSRSASRWCFDWLALLPRYFEFNTAI